MYTYYIALLLASTTHAFSNTLCTPWKNRAVAVPNKIISHRTFTVQIHQSRDDNNDETKVAVGSKEYYAGFTERSLSEEPAERVTGDAILGPTFKFVGGAMVVIVALLVGFMASNGLLL